MDAWNLAVCVGPTLVAARGEGGAQVAQQNLVNDLLKRLILRHEEVFPQHIAPHTLYHPPRYFTFPYIRCGVAMSSKYLVFVGE